MKSTRYSCQILMKLEISRHIFENTQIKNFMKICRAFQVDERGGQIARERQTERECVWSKHEKAYACFSQFCERALTRWLENLRIRHPLGRGTAGEGA